MHTPEEIEVIRENLYSDTMRRARRALAPFNLYDATVEELAEAIAEEVSERYTPPMSEDDL